MSLIKSTYISVYIVLQQITEIESDSVSILMKCCRLQMSMESKCINLKTAQIFPGLNFFLFPTIFTTSSPSKKKKNKTQTVSMSLAFNDDGCVNQLYTQEVKQIHFKKSRLQLTATNTIEIENAMKTKRKDVEETIIIFFGSMNKLNEIV